MEVAAESERTIEKTMSRDVKDVKMALNGPVYFLIQEQAKSISSIQALQARMAVLENLQERLMQAIDEVNKHLALEARTQKNPPAKSSSIQRGKCLRFLESVVVPNSELTKSELCKSDSLNKDSGIDASDSSLSQAEDHKSLDDDDELLHLLDVIDQRSLVLLRQVEGICDEKKDQRPMEMEKNNKNSGLIDNLLFEKVDVQRQLSEVKAERDELRERLAKLELATKVVNKQKLKVQQELDTTLKENKSLQNRVYKPIDLNSKTESLGYMTDIARSNIRRKYLQYSEKSRLKVSNILKEVNILELQKQLLTYVMENDILRAKLQQEEPSKLANLLQVESKLRKNLIQISDENQRLHELIQTKNLEIASLKDRIRLLEEGASDTDSCVKNFGMGSTEDWREPGVQNIYNKRSNLATASPFTPLGYGDFSKTQSLPAMLLQGAQVKPNDKGNNQGHYGHIFNTDSFTDIPLHHSYRSDQTNSYQLSTNNQLNSKELVDLSSPVEHHFSSTSTLVQSNFVYQPTQPTLHSGLSAPNLSSRLEQGNLQNWCFGVQRRNTYTASDDGTTSAKLINGHLYWKSSSSPIRHQSEDISSICSEFDPLSEESPSGENFVDSLNLSIPLKPIPVEISQLSSVGDSLHSTSLDLGRSSTPHAIQVQNAKSVDGIRELLLLENNYGQKQVRSSHSSVASVMQSGKHLPMNVVNCMHVTNDYSIL